MKEYDFYGAYDVEKNKDYKYNELLGQEYTFDFPPHHDIVSILNLCSNYSSTSLIQTKTLSQVSVLERCLY